MPAPFRDDSIRTPLARLCAEPPTGAQEMCSRVLRLLEAELRALALLALADWEQLAIVEPSLFPALGNLQRPSWGSWNFLLQSLRNARRTQLRTAAPGVRAAFERGRVLADILGYVDQSAAAEMVAAARPLATYLGGKQRLKRVGDVLVLPIALRNQIAHFPPDDTATWQEIATALLPLATWFAAHPAPQLVDRTAWPAPWFLDADDEIWAFNGVDKDFTVAYASVNAGRPRHEPARSGDLVRSMQKLVGRADLQDASFHRLLGKLAPAEIRGVILGDFLVGAPVGRGGFATVHVGRQLSTGRKVAVKLLHDGLGEEARQRFQQEAGFLSRVDHPAIVGIISHGEDAWSVPRMVDLGDEPWFQELARGAAIKTYMALEWIEGRTLEQVFQAVHVAKSETAPDGPTLRGWFITAAEALAAVHAAGLIHRDVKPANLMVSTDGELRLMDFGVARSDDENRTLMTNTGFAVGTPPYMSPEQLRANDAEIEVGPATDVYSLCATFYELATGARVFAHDREPADSVRTQKLAGRLPVRPRQIMKGLTWELETILLGGLQPEVEDRYRSAGALARDLAHWQNDEPIEYRRPSLARRTRLLYRRHRLVTHAAVVMVAIGGLAYREWSARRAASAIAAAETRRSRALEDQRAERARREGKLEACRCGEIEIVVPDGSSLAAIRPIPANDGMTPWGPGTALDLQAAHLGQSSYALPSGFFVVEYRAGDRLASYGIQSLGRGDRRTFTAPALQQRPGFTFIGGGVVPVGDLLAVGYPDELPLSAVTLAPYFIANDEVHGTDHQPLRVSFDQALAYGEHHGATLPSAVQYEWAAVLGASPTLLGDHWEWTRSRYLPYPYEGDGGRDNQRSADPRREVRGGPKILLAETGCDVADAMPATEEDPPRPFQLPRPSLRGCGEQSRTFAFRLVVELAPVTPPEVSLPEPIRFAPDSATPSFESARRLRTFAARYLAAGLDREIICEGHHSSAGTEEYNVMAAERYADGVRRFLVDEGIPRHRIQTITFGESRSDERAAPQLFERQNRVELRWSRD